MASAPSGNPLAGDDNGSVALASNLRAKRRQQLIMWSLIGATALGGGWWIMSPAGTQKPALESASQANEAKSVKISTDDMVNHNLADKEWQSLSENQLATQGNQIKTLQGDSTRIDELQKQIQDLQGQNSNLKADGGKVLSAYQSENEQLRTQISQLSTQVQRATAGPSAMYGPGGQQAYQRANGAGAPGAPGGPGVPGAAGAAPAPARVKEVRLINFSGDGSGSATRITSTKSTQYSDSENYLPPNSIASAKVVVGVDATTNTRSQTDPLPVVLRIMGPARSVYAQGKLLKTDIVGCMVNGAAMGDLSSEKVYVKLQRMTCPQPGGRVAVSEVKGFIAFGGKTGVRGRVVSRVGNLVGKAAIAGILGGFGRGFSANSTSFLTSPTVSVNGQRSTLSPTDIIQGGLGQGVASTGEMVSHYLIERAEQYQSVIEMPTGLDVEVVFLDGVFIRN